MALGKIDLAGNHDSEGWSSFARFLHEEVESQADSLEIMEVNRPIGGASWETFLVDYRTAGQVGSSGLRRVVVRRAPASGPMAPYEIRKDALIFGHLAESEVPVPRLLAWTEDPAVFRRPFAILEYVEGESPDLSQVERWPLWQSDREGLGLEMVRRLADLQRFRWQGTELATALGPPGDARQRLAAVLNRYLGPLFADAEKRRVGVAIWREIGAWILDRAPDIAEEDLVLVHGDYRFGNFIWQGTKIAAVLDWERAMLGAPMQDLGFICMPLSRRRAPEVMGKVLRFDDIARAYERESGRPVDIAEIQFFAVFWQLLEGVNTTRALLQERAPMIASGVLVQPNLIARQTLRLIDDVEAGREKL